MATEVVSSSYYAHCIHHISLPTHSYASIPSSYYFIERGIVHSAAMEENSSPNVLPLKKILLKMLQVLKFSPPSIGIFAVAKSK